MVSRRAILLSLGAATLPGLATSAGVKIGVCGPIADFAAADACGFDYFEPGAAAIASLDDRAFADFRDRVAASRLRCESVNSLIRTLKVVGPSVNLNAVADYLNATFDRCRQLGARIAVWGSAGSRNVPEGYSRDVAWRQIQAFLQLAGDIARSREMVLAIEPLERQESNIINTGGDALRLVHEVGHPNVKMIIDYYHMRRENETPDIVLQAAGQIAHLHFANPNGRVWPKDPAEDAEYGNFFERLTKIGYRGRISIEGRGRLREDAPASLAFFRRELTGSKTIGALQARAAQEIT